MAHQAVDVPTQDVGQRQQAQAVRAGCAVDDHGIPAAILDEPAERSEREQVVQSGDDDELVDVQAVEVGPAEEPPEVVRDDAPGALQLTSAVEVYPIHIRRHCHRVGAEAGGEHIAERVSGVSRQPRCVRVPSGRRECSGRRQGGFTNTTLAGHKDNAHPHSAQPKPAGLRVPRAGHEPFEPKDPRRSLAPLLVDGRLDQRSSPRRA